MIIPHQGLVALTASAISIVIVFTVMLLGFRDEKKNQQSNDDDH
jgi:hypothetical protein